MNIDRHTPQVEIQSIRCTNEETPKLVAVIDTIPPTRREALQAVADSVNRRGRGFRAFFNSSYSSSGPQHRAVVHLPGFTPKNLIQFLKSLGLRVRKKTYEARCICGPEGRWHRILIRVGGPISAPDHTRDELNALSALRVLGEPMPGCIRNWLELLDCIKGRAARDYVSISCLTQELSGSFLVGETLTKLYEDTLLIRSTRRRRWRVGPRNLGPISGEGSLRNYVVAGSIVKRRVR